VKKLKIIHQKNDELFFFYVYLYSKTNNLTKMKVISSKPIGKSWWFDLSDGEWKPEYNGKGHMSSSYYAMTYDGFTNVWLLKAAKR
jgi:hypothetical protein